jgi:hypothetical protein
MTRKVFVIIISVLLPVLAWGQAQINTKKVKIGDFTQKITKVVLSGNEFMDSALKDEVTARWRISPYEFCSLEEFGSMKTSEDYYFLIITNGQFKKDSSPTIQFLTLVKGGKGADESIDGMLEVVSMPIASALFPSGREIVFLPAFLDIIQSYTLDSMEKDTNAYGGLGNYSGNIMHSDDHRIVLSRDDLAIPSESLEDGSIKLDEGMSVAEEEEVDELMLENAENTIVSYVVAPFEPQPGAYCYKMLIDTQTHKLYYYKRHRISSKAGAGFLKDDLKRIYAVR